MHISQSTRAYTDFRYAYELKQAGYYVPMEYVTPEELAIIHAEKLAADPLYKIPVETIGNKAKSRSRWSCDETISGREYRGAAVDTDVVRDPSTSAPSEPSKTMLEYEAELADRNLFSGASDELDDPADSVGNGNNNAKEYRTNTVKTEENNDLMKLAAALIGGYAVYVWLL